MTDDMMAVIREEATKKYPEEACGLIVKVGKKSLTVPCKNISPRPTEHFLMCPNDYSAAADRGEIVGAWHTHTELPPRPSDADRAGCNNSEIPWYIVGVFKSGDDFVFEGPAELVPDGFEMPYLERPYVAGVFDCHTLVKDYYRREHNIEIGSYPYILADGRQGQELFTEVFSDEGFKRLIDEEPQVGDVFIIRISGTNHLAVYLGDDIIMHHMIGRLSHRDVYGGMWAKHTTHHLRHKELLNVTN